MSESTPVGTDDINQKAIDALEKAGLIPTEAAVFICEFIGKELQGVPSQYRKLAISRLRNKAKLLESAGFPYDSSRLIEAVCKSWETFD